MPRPQCNLTFTFQGEEFRPDDYWPGLGLTGEADGRGKYGKQRWVEDPLWAERIRQQWFEDELGMEVFRWIDREMRHTPDAAAARWWRLAARPEVRAVDAAAGLGDLPQAAGSSALMPRPARGPLLAASARAPFSLRELALEIAVTRAAIRG